MNLKAKKHLLDIDSYSKEEILQILNDSKIMMEILNRRVKKIAKYGGNCGDPLVFDFSISDLDSHVVVRS